MAKNVKKLASNIIHLSGAVQVALFNEILLAEITQAGGRWNAVKTKGHVEPFLDCRAIVTPEGALPGLQFVARKKNYNFNDSNWVGQDEVLKRLQAVASKVTGAEVPKKHIYSYLQDIKDTMKASTFTAPVTEAPATPPAQPTESEVIA